MAIFKCKQEYSFTIDAATDKEATTLLERFHQEEDKILYASGSRVKADRSTAFSMHEEPSGPAEHRASTLR